MQLTSEQARACQALLDELKEPHSLQTDETWSTFPADEDWQNHLDNDTDLSEDSDDEVFEDSGGTPAEEQLVSSGGQPQASWEFIAETPVQLRILELLIALYTHLPHGGEDKFYSPIIRFVVLFSRTKTSQWALPRRITQSFAVLLFCGRVVMMALMHRALLADKSIRYSQYVVSL